MTELSLHILDIAQNSIAADAGYITISLCESLLRDTLEITIRDDGRGMDEESRARATDPFFTSRKTRPVGLGLPLFRMAAQLTGGDMTVESAPGRGTEVHAVFGLSHIDRPPLGNLRETLLLLISCNPQIDFCYERFTDGGGFSFDTKDVREAVGASPAEPEALRWISDHLHRLERGLS